LERVVAGLFERCLWFGVGGWTASELVFNACVWQGGYRTFQPSRGLQKTIGWTPGKDDAIYWSSNTASFEDEGGEKHDVLIWQKSLLDWIPGRETEPDIPGPDLPAPPGPDLPAPPGPDLPEPYDPWWDDGDEE